MFIQPDPPETESEAHAERARVALIDDERDVLETVQAILELDFDVKTFDRATRAIDAIQAREFDVICTDCVMPEMDGIELLHRVLELKIPLGFVIVTGRDDRFFDATLPSPRERRGVALSVLTKPYRPDELLAAIERAWTFTKMHRVVHAKRQDGAA